MIGTGLVIYFDSDEWLIGVIGFHFVMFCGKAWMTPSIEALMNNQTKLDPERGTEDLETFGMGC